MNDALNGEEVPHSWKQAAITSIPKERLELLDVKNYRPVSLLNTDYKIYAKILENRLKWYLVDYINEDQSGFLSRWHLKDNIRILLNVIEVYNKAPERQLGLIFVDTKKVFDNLHWEFKISMSEEKEIGKIFLNAIRGIYNE